MSIAVAIIIVGTQFCATWAFVSVMRMNAEDNVRRTMRELAKSREQEQQEGFELARKLALRDMRRRVGN